jgi:hypothetical protein
MNTQVQMNNLSHEDVQIRIEEYRTTIHALEAFVSMVTWDPSSKLQIPGSRFSIGRRMDTSSANRISPNCTVTPDTVVQRDVNLGYVVEAKISLPQNNNDNWRDVVYQMVKYDDDLTGWWTEKEMILVSCPVLLLHISRSADFRMYLESLIDGKQVYFVKPVSIVEFNRSLQVKEFLFLRLHWGEIEDPDVLQALKRGCQIPIENVLANPSYGEKKFCDFPPIPEHTMTILWQDIFTEMKQKVEYDQNAKAYPLNVNVENLTLELQKLYGVVGKEPRQITYPRVEWVRDALDCFVKLGLAKKVDEIGNYLILFKLIRQNIVEYFRGWRDVKNSEETEQQEKQLLLFEMDQ